MPMQERISPLKTSLPVPRRLVPEALDPAQAEVVAHLLKALADPVRVRLMSLIAAAGEACVCDLSAPFGVSQPTISHHLRVLRDAGLSTQNVAERGCTTGPGARRSMRSVNCSLRRTAPNNGAARPSGACQVPRNGLLVAVIVGSGIAAHSSVVVSASNCSRTH